MDHAEARELLELAALEPGGLDRLMAGADERSADVLAHLGACADCQDQLTVLRRSVDAIRDVVQTTPASDLRTRTLDHVARFGRERSQARAGADGAATPTGGPLPWFRSGLIPALAAGVAAVALIAAVLTGGAVSSRLAQADADIAEQRTTIAALSLVTDWSLRLSADPDATRVRLESPSGGAQTGSLIFSDTTNELLMVANGLPVPDEGQEYRCWVQVGNTPVPIGAMYRAGDLAYWAGAIGQDAMGDGEDRTFGVSLVPSGSVGVDGDVVLVGES